MHQLVASHVWITLYSGPRPLFRDLRKFLEGIIFINTLKSLIMRDSQEYRNLPVWLTELSILFLNI